VPKLALITGASSGIGAETARLVASEGWEVVLIARDASRLQDVARSIGARAHIERCDAADGHAVLAMAARVRSSLGVPDVIVNGAGLGRWERIEDTPPDEARLMIGAPYLAAFNLTHALMKDMLSRRSGVLIHVNSPAAYSAWPAAVGYIAARAALHGMYEALRQDLVGTGVHSCEAVFGEVASEYHGHNPGVDRHMPGIERTIRTLSTGECARVIADVAKRPKSEVVHPLMLRLYRWQNQFMPGIVRWVLWRTGARRRS
jgi:NADP-dependent 3-hydroxy acid dehydrogenase YdfG